MEKEEFLPANDFCTYHHVSYSFISGLEQAGLIEIATIEDQQYLHQDQLREVEKLVRMHTELEINMEGIEAIAHLLHRMKQMQQELKTLQLRLQLYNDEQQGI